MISHPPEHMSRVERAQDKVQQSRRETKVFFRLTRPLFVQTGLAAGLSVSSELTSRTRQLFLTAYLPVSCGGLGL